MRAAAFKVVGVTGAEQANVFADSQFEYAAHNETAFFAIVISLIGAFQIFDNVWVLTEGGPGDASRVIAMYIYEKAFKGFEMGYASAVSLTLFAILIALTLGQFYGARRWVHYE